jgi:16S rRNA C967 or C1407 C5-methylase (RsmB/RsmF family)/NOL1/NOP2/fmu family ribosome biogenesis protein
MAMSEVLFPPTFASRMRDVLGDRWPAFVETHGLPAPTSIRINPYKSVVIHGDSSVPWATGGRYLVERPVFTLDPLFHAGAYYVQEASSMFLEQALRQSADLTAPLTVLDLCAAPGGKSTHLLSLLSPESLLVSNEVIRSRASILSENIQKWGQPNVVVTNSDPEHIGQFRELFDVIVVDAPCSGEGMFRKDAHAMTEWSTDHVALCASRQRRILSDIWPALKTGGVLIYCTCTYNTAENEENLNWLANEQSVSFVKLALPDNCGIEAVTQGRTTGYRFYPQQVKGEGFFLSVVRKEPGEASAHSRPPKSGKKVFASPPKKIEEKVSGWLTGTEDKSVVQFQDIILILPERWKSLIEVLSERLHVIHAGVSAGTVKHEKVIPEHALALSSILDTHAFQRVDVSEADALKYLRKEAVFFEGLEKGYTLVCYQGIPLGWINVLDNRANNLYPAEWRIRMK